MIDDTFAPLEAPGAGAAEGARTRIGRFDLDLNAHANNVAIFRALLEALPDTPPPFTLEAEFRGESFEGDLLEARAKEDGGTRASPCSAHRTAARSRAP